MDHVASLKPEIKCILCMHLSLYTVTDSFLDQQVWTDQMVNHRVSTDFPPVDKLASVLVRCCHQSDLASLLLAQFKHLKLCQLSA